MLYYTNANYVFMIKIYCAISREGDFTHNNYDTNIFFTVHCYCYAIEC